MTLDEPPPLSERAERKRLAPPFFLALLALALAGLFLVLRSFIPDLVVTFILVAMFRPLWRRLAAALGGREWLASGLVTALIVVVVAGPIAFVLTTLGKEAVSLARRVHASDSVAFASSVGQRVEEVLHTVGLPVNHEQLAQAAVRARDWLTASVVKETTALVGSTLGLLFHVMVVLVAVFYLLVDADRLRRFVKALSPLPDAHGELLARKFDGVARGILIGNGVGSALQGLLGGLAMAVVGLPSPVLWGTVMTLFAFLPLVGISVVTVPAALYLAYTGRVAAAIGFFAFCSVQGLVIENVIKTRLIGRSTRMHDLIIFLSVLGGIGEFGVMGLLYGPLIVAVFLTLSDLYVNVYRRELGASWAGLPPRSG
ncbi:MAG: AI-2E family transporter [Sorangiineae bacterium]|nr:AI-2E family transporter [Polyangiaceae bacterium]MEB2324929.1 AI-2E family transporter [Sorangiineae bacterium]